MSDLFSPITAATAFALSDFEVLVDTPGVPCGVLTVTSDQAFISRDPYSGGRIPLSPDASILALMSASGYALAGQSLDQLKLIANTSISLLIWKEMKKPGFSLLAPDVVAMSAHIGRGQFNEVLLWELPRHLESKGPSIVDALTLIANNASQHDEIFRKYLRSRDIK